MKRHNKYDFIWIGDNEDPDKDFYHGYDRSKELFKYLVDEHGFEKTGNMFGRDAYKGKGGIISYKGRNRYLIERPGDVKYTYHSGPNEYTYAAAMEYFKELKEDRKMNFRDMKELKAMFDQINADCKKSGESCVPYSDTEYYADQIYNIFNDKEEGEAGIQDPVEADELAMMLYGYAKKNPTKITKLKENTMDRDSNSFQSFQQELSQKLNAKLFDRLMSMKKIIASKVVGEKSEENGTELERKKAASPLQIAYRKHFKDSLQRHHSVDCISKVHPEKKGEFFKRLGAEWVPGKGSIHDGHKHD